MSRFNMPSKREKDAENNTSTGNKFWKPLPVKAGQRHNNNVIIPIFSPAKWKLFNPTVEETQKYGYVGVGGSLVGVPEDLGTPYFQVPCHSVDNFQFSRGMGNAHVVCPIKTNEYLQSLYPDARLFDSPKCAFCEKEHEAWEEHNSQWKALGIDNRSMTPEGRRSFVEQNEDLKRSYKKAMSNRAFPKYILNVFDYDKMTGKRSMDEGQEQVEFQIWFAPRSVFESLRNLILQDEPVEFWAESNPIPIVTVIKNTEKCKPNDMMQTRYQAQFVGTRVEMDPAWVQYLCNVDAMVDPSNYLQVLTYEEQSFYLSDDEGGNNYQSPKSTPDSSTAAQPPAAQPPAAQPPAAQPPAAQPPAAQPPAAQPPAAQPPAAQPNVPTTPATPPIPAMPPSPQPPAVTQNDPPPMTPPPAAQPPAAQPPAAQPPAAQPPNRTPDQNTPPSSGTMKWD